MTEERLCPACSEEMPDSDPRRRWCSARCRRLVNKLGGPAGLAEHYEANARTWIRMGPDSNPDYKQIAAELRASARRLRQVGA
jgi:hypothetical protein